jgi:ribokinase
VTDLDETADPPVERRPIEDLQFVVVGAYVADCFIRTPRLPAWGQAYEARSIRMTPGGKALNQAVALARLGAQVTAVGVVGDDGTGRDVLDALGCEGVDADSIEVRDGAATTVCLCFVSDDGESSIMWHIDDDVAITPQTVQSAAAAIERADAMLLTFEAPVPALGEAISLASRHGTKIFVQPAPVHSDRAVATLPWDQVDVLVPNETEARALLASSDTDSAHDQDDLAKLVADKLGVLVAAVTLGSLGCVVHAAGATGRYPVHQAETVDTTGASDAFTAALAAHLTAGATLGEAVHSAQTAAAWVIGRSGSRESMPSVSIINATES